VADTGRFVAESFRIGRNVQLSIPHSKHQIVFIRARYSWRCLAALVSAARSWCGSPGPQSAQASRHHNPSQRDASLRSSSRPGRTALRPGPHYVYSHHNSTTQSSSNNNSPSLSSLRLCVRLCPRKFPSIATRRLAALVFAAREDRTTFKAALRSAALRSGPHHLLDALPLQAPRVEEPCFRLTFDKGWI